MSTLRSQGAPSSDLHSPNGYHPVDPEAARDPYPALAELRRVCPVSRPERDGFPPVTLFTRRTDIATILRDYKTFGNIGFFPAIESYRATPDDQRPIIELDPPRHTAARRLNLVAMRPAAIDRALPRVTETADRLVHRFLDRGKAELVGEFAVPLPADAIATVLGLPADDAEMIHDWVESTFSEPAADDARIRPEKPTRDLDAAFDGYLLEQLDRRRRAAVIADDAIGRMLQFRTDDGRAFTDEELCIHIRTLLMAGNETTTSLLSNAVYRLLTVPGVYERVRSDRDLVDPFIEECLRFDAPLTQFPRRCRAKTTMAGVDLDPDDVVVVSMPSANRDEEFWGDDADQFRLERFVDRPADHLSFGMGIHHCVGAYLARRTAHIALNVLLDATAELRLAPGYRYDKVWFFEFWRPKRLDVVFRRSSPD